MDYGERPFEVMPVNRQIPLTLSGRQRIKMSSLCLCAFVVNLLYSSSSVSRSKFDGDTSW
jgi:hypothetical protein